MKNLKRMVLTLVMAFAIILPSIVFAETKEVKTQDELAEVFKNGGEAKLTENLTLTGDINVNNGKTVTLPIFDFKTNSRLEGRTLKINEHDPLVIEGIHALNEQMTALIPKYLKFKIYISPQAQINVDAENPISMTDVRLLRRIVRDFKYRNASAEETLSMWPNVRKGEFKWIYDTQEDANYVFDSFLNIHIL